MLLDLLFPKYCGGCRRLGSFVCKQCSKNLPYIDKNVCFYCRRGSFMGITHPMCRKTRGVDMFICVLRYDNLVKRFIKEVKYRFAQDVWKEILHVVEPTLFDYCQAIKRVHPTFIIQAVPITSRRLRERGFNQSATIARIMSRLSGSPIVHAVVRQTDAQHQAQIRDIQARKTNVRHAFSPAPRVTIKDQCVVLVDDVVTSGATTQSVARVLKSMGARYVVILALAKG